MIILAYLTSFKAKKRKNKRKSKLQIQFKWFLEMPFTLIKVNLSEKNLV